MNQELIEAVLAQILADIADGDTTALEELLRACPEQALRGYLPQGDIVAIPAFRFKCYDYSHGTHKWGIEYATDPDGENLVDVEWFETEHERNAAFNATQE